MRRSPDGSGWRDGSGWDVLTFAGVFVLLAIFARSIAPAAATPRGQWVCEMGCEGSRTYASKGLCPVCRMALSPVNDRGPTMKVSERASSIPGGVGLGVQLFDSDGRPIARFEPASESQAVVAVASDDLGTASSSRIAIDPKGEGQVDPSALPGGRYQVFAAFRPAGESIQVASDGFSLPGAPVAGRPLVEDFDEVRVVGDLDARIRCNGSLYFAGGLSYLRFGIQHEGKAVCDFEPIFGEPAYVLIVNAESRKVVKTHALSVAPFLNSSPGDPAPNVHIHKTHQGQPDEVNPLTLRNGEPTDIAVQAVFPEPGMYRVFAYFLRKGELICFPFTIDAKPRPAR